MIVMKRFIAVLAIAATAFFAAPALAAVNPFMDVPQGHWSYDAVGLLASRGIVSGYPDGAFKGGQPATRYEMASIVARALAAADAEKAGKQDMELLKKLVMEFKDELDALGVKVDSLDKRVAVLEEGLGGWQLHGTFTFDAKFGDSDSGAYAYSENGQKNEFEKDQFRLYLTKQINERTYFFAEYRTGGDDAGERSTGLGDMEHMSWANIFVDTKLPYDIGLRVGRFTVDFEDDYGFYSDNDALFGDFRTDGFMLTKKWDTFGVTAIAGRNDSFSMEEEAGLGEGDMMSYILDLNWQPNENFMFGATGYWFQEDSSSQNGDFDVNVYGVYASYSFTPAVALKGIYYFEDLGADVPGAADEDGPQSWKAILDIDQDLLKFTSLWVEYSQQDNTFIGYDDRYAIGGNVYDHIGYNIDFADPSGTSKWWFVKAEQQWNDKWLTFVRFASVDFDSAAIDDATEWGVGVGYQYSPALYFELSYDEIDHGDGNARASADALDGKESVVRFRTVVNF